MDTIEALARRWLSGDHPVGIVLTEQNVIDLAVTAVQKLAGWVYLKEHGYAPGEVSAATVLTYSEWALARPVFDLMVMAGNARALESSRSFGVEPYGRSTSEIEGDLRMVIEQLPKLAFVRDVETL